GALTLTANTFQLSARQSDPEFGEHFGTIGVQSPIGSMVIGSFSSFYTSLNELATKPLTGYVTNFSEAYIQTDIWRDFGGVVSIARVDEPSVLSLFAFLFVLAGIRYRFLLNRSALPSF